MVEIQIGFFIGLSILAGFGLFSLFVIIKCWIGRS
jgi:hypothetical protein